MSNNTIHPSNPIAFLLDFDPKGRELRDIEYCPNCTCFRQADQSGQIHICLTCGAETLFVESLYQDNLRPAWANGLISKIQGPTSPDALALKPTYVIPGVPGPKAPAAPSSRPTKYTYSEGMTDREKKALRKAARKAAKNGRLPEKDYL